MNINGGFKKKGVPRRQDGLGRSGIGSKPGQGEPDPNSGWPVAPQASRVPRNVRVRPKEELSSVRWSPCAAQLSGKQKPRGGGGGHSTFLLTNPDALVSNPGSAKIFYLHCLVCGQHKDRPIPFLSKGFHKCSLQSGPEQSTAKKYWEAYLIYLEVDRGGGQAVGSVICSWPSGPEFNWFNSCTL